MTMDVQWDQAGDMAIAKCKEIQSEPVIIHNSEQHTYWATAAVTTWSNMVLLGLVCNTTSMKYEWADGSALDFKSWFYAADLDKDCKKGVSWYITPEYFWSYGSGTSKWTANIFCTKQLQPPVPSADGCDSFEDDSEDGVCYQVGATAESWRDAQMICQKHDANLASIHNIQENSFIRRVAVSKGVVNGVFLGAMSGGNDNFSWVDGSIWDYDNFHQGFPMAGFGNCLAMDTSISTGLWMNIDCSAKLPVVCARQQKAVAEPICSAGPWEEGTIITSPGFPYNASTFCDYFLAVEAGKRVEIEIIFLEANSCCDSLVLYDGYLGSTVIASLTGEMRNITYTTTESNIMRANWQPNGAVNVMGMVMTFRGV